MTSSKHRRRAPGDGSLRLRSDGRWEGRLEAGFSPQGRRKRTSVFGATREEAAARLRQELELQSDGLPPADGRATLASYLAAWLKTVEPRLRPATLTRYQGIVKGQLIPYLGRVKLTQVTPDHVDKMMAQVQEAGLSARTAAHCRAVLRASLQDAMRTGRVRRNVAQLAHAPHVDAPDPMVLSPTEALAMIDAISDPGLRRLATVAAFCGLRQSEQLALTWDDVDFKGRKLHIRRGLHRIGGSYQLTEVKSGSSKRVVALTDPALEALRDEQQAQREAKLAAGGSWHQPVPGLCFTTAQGQPRSGTAVTHAFQSTLAKAGLPAMRWHDLRAVYGALLLQAGTDISVVSKMLGHSAVGVTSRHYAGVGEALGRQATDRLGELLRRPAAPAN